MEKKNPIMKNLYIITTLHKSNDHRIYRKEALSLKNLFNITFIVPSSKASEIIFPTIQIKGNESKLTRLNMLIKIFFILKDKKPDIIMFHDFEAIFLIPLIRLFIPHIKIIYDMHEDYPHQVLISRKFPFIIKHFLGIFFSICEFFILRQLNHLFVADSFLYKKFYSTVNGKITILYNFPSLKLISQNTHKKDCVVYAGGLSFERGLKDIIALSTSMPETDFILIGRTFTIDEENYLTQFLQKNKNLHHLGPLPYTETLKQIAKCKYGLVLLHPNEKFKRNISVKQFDYMSQGTIPLIRKGLVCFVKYGFNGYVVNDTQEAVNILNSLKKKDISNISHNCIYTIKQYFNWEKEETKFTKTMKNIL